MTDVELAKGVLPGRSCRGILLGPTLAPVAVMKAALTENRKREVAVRLERIGPAVFFWGAQGDSGASSLT